MHAIWEVTCGNPSGAVCRGAWCLETPSVKLKLSDLAICNRSCLPAKTGVRTAYLSIGFHTVGMASRPGQARHGQEHRWRLSESQGESGKFICGFATELSAHWPTGDCP